MRLGSKCLVALASLISMVSGGGLVAQTLNALTIPDTLSGSVIQLTIDQDSVQFLGGAKTATMGFNGPFLGPTLILRRSDQVQMQVVNNLPDTTTVHWHGMHVAAANDGGPHTTIAPGTTWSPAFKVLDEASTYWYHPHMHMHTAEHVNYGAAGMIIVRDSLEDVLQLPRRYGVDDFPIIIQDRSFDSTSHQFIYEALADTVMINGTLNPYLRVPGQVVRLRLLNGSLQRVYNLGFPAGISFLISSDGGLLEAPLPITRILIAPGERAEILVDFSGLSQNLPLVANNSEMGVGVSGGPQGPGGGPGNPLDGNNFQVLEFQVTPPTANPVTTIPTTLRSYAFPNPQDVDRTRIKVLDTLGSAFAYFINDTPFDMDFVNDTVELGDIEIWEIRNQSDAAHPMHIHDVQFHVLDRDGLLPPGHLRGWKDVLLVQPGDTFRIIMQFLDFADEHTPYMFHCHNLFHEDFGMMGQFIVVDSVPIGHVDPQFQSFCSNLRLFPNPTSGLLQLDDNNIAAQRVESIEVWDLHGRRLQVFTLADGRHHEFDLSYLPPSVYLLHLRHKGGGHAVLRVTRQ